MKEFLCALQDVAREANEFLSSFGGLNESRLAAIDKLTAIQPFRSARAQLAGYSYRLLPVS
ncbi:MAG TPA: hypothetical protein VNO32_43395 [Candidatus Acidoferrum sp.]|nr:hypothetical protein [Candidatus Acidoferrum sp.]